jgi:hypothetical protein
MTSPSSSASVAPRRPRHGGGKILYLFIAGAIVLTLALLPFLVSMESVKRRLVGQLEAALQRRVDVGRVHLQIFSGLGAGLEGLTIHNPPGWQHPYLLKAGTLSVKIAWWPLWQGRLDITRVILSDGELTIERDAQGRLNVADLWPARPQGEATPPGPPQPPSQSPQPSANPPPLEGLLVSELVVQDVTLRFVDRLAAADKPLTATLSDVRLRLRDVAMGMPMPFELAASALSDRRHNLRIDGVLGPVPPDLVQTGLPIEGHLRASDLLVGQLKPYVGPGLPLAQGRASAAVDLRGQLGKRLQLRGELILRQAALDGGLLGGPATAVPDLTATYEVGLDAAAGALQLQQARLALAGMQATATGSVRRLWATPQFDLRVTTDRFGLADAVAAWPVLTAGWSPPAALQGSAELQARLQGSRQQGHVEAQAALDDVVVKSGVFAGGPKDNGGALLESDATRATMTVLVAPAQPPHVQLDVQAKRLVFEHQAATSRPSPADQGGAPPPAGRPPPAPTPSRLTLDGQVRIGEGRLQQVPFQQLTADLAFADGVLRVQQQLHIYGGSYRGQTQVDLRPPAPRYSLTTQLDGVNIGQALNELTPVKNAFVGALSSDLQLAGQGLTWESLSRSLSGQGRFKIVEARLPALDLLPKLVQALRAVAGLELPAGWDQETFDAIEGDLDLRQGKIFTEALTLRRKGLEVLLKGAVGLDRSLDYAGQALVPGQLFGERGLSPWLRRDERGRVIVPFSVKGTVASPQVAFDERALQDVVKGLLLDRVKQHLGGEAAAPAPPPGGAEQASPPRPQDLPRKLLEQLLRR